MKKGARPPINVVAGLIFRGGELLICQRRETAAFALKWEFPGGKVENGEDGVAALRRELKEELAVEVREAELFAQYEHCYENGPLVFLQFYQVANFVGVPRNLVFQQVLWVGLDKLPEFDFLEGDRRVIEQLVKHGLLKE